MALSANALTTVSALLGEVGAVENPTHTALAERFINAASDFVVSHCKRPFVRRSDVDRKRGIESPILFLARTPVLSVASVVIEDVTQDVSTYRIENVGGVDQALFRACGWKSTAAFGSPVTRGPIAGTEGADIVVTYEGGFVTPAQEDDDDFDSAPRTLPYDLEDAVIRLATSRWRQRGEDVRMRARGFEASAVTFGGERVPPEVLATLERYTRISHR